MAVPQSLLSCTTPVFVSWVKPGQDTEVTGRLLASLHHLGFPLSPHNQAASGKGSLDVLPVSPACLPSLNTAQRSPKTPCPCSARSPCSEVGGDVYSKTSQVDRRCLLQGGQQRELSGSQVQTLLTAFSRRAGDRNLGKGLQDIETSISRRLRRFKLSGCDGVNQSH